MNEMLSIYSTCFLYAFSLNAAWSNVPFLETARVDPAGADNMTTMIDSQARSGDEGRVGRGFIATQACETCRIKKTRCDEDKPCSLCKSLGVECQYRQRKETKKDTSMAMLLTTLNRTLNRVEGKLEELSSTMKPSIVKSPAHFASDFGVSNYSPQRPSYYSHVYTTSIKTINHDLPEDHSKSSQPTRTPISFSQHQVPFWPAYRDILPPSVFQHLESDYAINLELQRPQLSIYTSPYPVSAGDSWLRLLPISVVAGLSEAFFCSFNLNNPVLDQDAYFNEILGVVIRDGFGFDAESCLVLNVLALGCLAVKTFEEGNFPLPMLGLFSNHEARCFESPEWIEVIREIHPGLRFFNEGRKRAGVLLCCNDLITCQFYLLSGLYYTQIIRPTDCWSMVNKACVCCLTLMKSTPDQCNEWERDMQCRIYWTAIMMETVLVQELNLPHSGLQQLEQIIPIPKFIPYPRMRKNLQAQKEDDTFFQFHFLAQVAHRIILTRIRKTLYFYSETEVFPPPLLLSELHHQLEQWQNSLPESIKFDKIPLYPRSPVHAFASALLKARFFIAKFHISRPFLYKALHNPGILTDGDLQACREGLESAMNWPQATGICRLMPTGIPIKFGLCSQYFGQLLLFHAILKSPDVRVRQICPVGYQDWCAEMLSFLKECAPLSKTLSKDMEILNILGINFDGEADDGRQMLLEDENI